MPERGVSLQSSKSKINAILQYAQALCQANVHGGRTMISSNHTGVMYDCPMWDDKFSEALICRYPHCRISIRDAQDTSTSGFAIFFHIEQRPLSWVVCKPSYMIFMLWSLVSIAHVLHLIKQTKTYFHFCQEVWCSGKNTHIEHT